MDNVSKLINLFDHLGTLTPEEIIEAIWELRDSGAADDLTELLLNNEGGTI